MQRTLVVKNSLSGVLVQIASTVLLFVTIPVFVRLLGQESYGLFSLLMVIGNLNTFANLGLSTSLIKFLAEQGKTKESDHDILVSISLIILLLLPLLVMALIFDDFILRTLLNVPAHMLGDAQWLFICLLLANCFLLVGQIFAGVLDSQQKIYLTNAYQLVYNILYWGLILVFLLLGFSLRAVSVALLISAVAWFVVVGFAAHRTWGPLCIAGLRSDFIRIARKQLHYGIQIYATGIVGFFYEPLTKILISHFIGISEVGFLDIALKIRNQIGGLLGRVLYPLYPVIAQMEEKTKVRELIHDLEQKIFILVIPQVSIVIFVAHPFVSLWIGKDVDIIANTVICIVSSYLIGSITVLPNYQYLIAKGHASKTLVLQGVNVVGNGLLFLILFGSLRYYAAVASNAGGIMLSFGVSLYYQSKYLKSLVFDSARQVTNLFLVLSINVVIGLILGSVLKDDLTRLLLVTVTLAGVSLGMFRYLRLFTSQDIARYFGTNTAISVLSAKVLLR